ncbi:hypothetical protein RDABS01_037330 [Bienertia sinuspersici]
MGEVLVLKFQYKGYDTDVIVDDPDTANMIDLVIDYQDEAKKVGNPCPRYPSFKYLYKMNHQHLNSDKELMDLFTNLPNKKLQYIWVEEKDEPTELMKSVKSLRSGKGIVSPESPMETANVNPITSVQVNDIQSPRRSQRVKQVQLGNGGNEDEGHANVPIIEEWQDFETEDRFDATLEETWPDIIIEQGIQDSPIQGRGKSRGKGRGKGRGKDSPIQGRGKSRGKGRGKVSLRGKGRGKGRYRVLHSMVNEVEHDIIGKTTTRLNSPCVSPSKSSATASGQVDNPQQQNANDKNCLHTEMGFISAPAFRKRIPRTTAARKGLLLTRGEANVSRNSEEVITTTNSEHGEIEEDNSPMISDHGEMEEDNTPMIKDDFDPYAEVSFEDVHDDGNEPGAVNYLQKLYSNGVLYGNEEYGKIELRPWMLFLEKDHLRSVVREYCIQCGFSVIVEKASNTRYTVRCSAAECGWRLHASRLADDTTWAIKSIQNSEHTCMGLQVNNPMQSTIYKMKSEALQKIRGGHDVSYSYLPKYCEMIKSTNPLSAAFCSWTPPTHPDRPLSFSTIFIAFRGALEGLFAGCRSLIGVDETHLKGNFRGILLSAVTLDGNNELFPVAWAIVPAEDTDNWKFFIWHLKNAFKDSGRGDNWCIISDRQKGIDLAIKELWPEVGRRYCCKHLSKNWKKAFPGPLMWFLFWKACGATSQFTFKKAMTELQKVNPTALVWLSKLGDQSTWTKHKFNPDIKSDVNKTNFVESFNVTLGVVRLRPVLTLLEGNMLNHTNLY